MCNQSCWSGSHECRVKKENSRCLTTPPMVSKLCLRPVCHQAGHCLRALSWYLFTLLHHAPMMITNRLGSTGRRNPTGALVLAELRTSWVTLGISSSFQISTLFQSLISDPWSFREPAIPGPRGCELSIT